MTNSIQSFIRDPHTFISNEETFASEFKVNHKKMLSNLQPHNSVLTLSKEYSLELVKTQDDKE